MPYTPYKFLDPASQNTTGRGGLGTSRGGQTFLGSALVPQSVAPVGGTRLSSPRSRQGGSRGSLITGTGVSGSMGRQRGPSEGDLSRRPSFLSGDAYFRARGSGLDWLGKYGPSRGVTTTSGSTGATYGGRTVGSAPSPATSGVGQGISESAFGGLATDNPYTSLTGDSIGATVSPTSPQGRYNQMTAEQNALAAAGLEEGRTMARQVQQLQDAEASPSGTVSTAGPFTVARTPYGTGISSVGRGVRKSFGSLGSSSPEQMRQDELGERAIAARNRAGVSTQSLLDSYRRRFQR